MTSERADPTLEEVCEACRDLSKEIARRLPQLSSTDLASHAALAGLAYARLVLDAMVERSDKHRELPGADLRTIFEAVVNALWLLVDPEDALDRFGRDAFRSRKQFA